MVLLTRKGVSPFISVILLIALAVAISVVMLNWTDLITRETAESVEEKIAQETVCNINIDLGILRDMQGYQRICLNTTTEELLVVFENKGSIRIENIHSSLLTNEGSSSAELGIDIVPGGVRVADVETNVSSPSLIQQVVFTPAAKIEDKLYWCTDKKITVQASSIGSC